MDLFALAAYMKAKKIKPSDIGAAPAGYGLGESSSASDTSWTGANRNAFVRSNSGSPDGAWWHGIVCKEYGTITTQLAFKPNDGVWLAAMRGRNANGTYGEWEYVNPPMIPGEEYRTTERWKGKAVYTKLIDITVTSEDLEGEDSLSVPVASGVDAIVSTGCWVFDGITFSAAIHDTYFEEGNVNCTIYEVPTDGNGPTEVTLQLKYTK